MEQKEIIDIREKYPKVWKLIEKWWNDSPFGNILDVNYCGVYKRSLYDFFDEHDFRILIDFDQEGYVEQGIWFYIIWEGGYGQWDNMGEGEVIYKTREEAENSAFTEAFGLLEQQLKRMQ